MRSFNTFHFKGQRDGEEVLQILRRHWFDIFLQLFWAFLILAFLTFISTALPSLFPAISKAPYKNLFTFLENLFLLLIWIISFLIWVVFYFNFWFVPNLLLQKFPAPAFTAKTKVTFNGDLNGDQCGLVVMGEKWAYLALTKEKDQTKIGLFRGAYHQCDDLTTAVESFVTKNELFLKVEVDSNGLCTFSFSVDDQNYHPIGEKFQAQKESWIGAKVGIFCNNPNIQESNGYADFDWFKVE